MDRFSSRRTRPLFGYHSKPRSTWIPEAGTSVIATASLTPWSLLHFRWHYVTPDVALFDF